MTLIPFLAALTLIAVGAAPFVGPFALAVLLVAFSLWVLWKATTNVLDLRGENIFQIANTSDLLGRGGPDDPDFILVRRRPNGAQDEAPTDDATAARTSSIDRTVPRGARES
jgi:hypothetical protein